MKIAFDLDNTLLRCGFDFELEKPISQLLSLIFGGEKLRKGTKEIFSFCKSNQYETWIYTSSMRNVFYIRKIFWLNGIFLDGIVNYQVHHKHIKKNITKYPPYFGIDVLIDDSEGVRIEAEKNNFKVIIIQPNNPNWVENIKDELLKINK
ncbi:MAG: HAD family hydrolase [Cytophagia bacterium]|nr:MAG: HAD family hydrolase [Cytophagales bacterium]TAG42356.1 MAG: HAD family hydrolase [Cytophagia bacterium]